MRQVDHEARVAARGPFCDPPRIEDDDGQAGVDLAQAPRGRQPGESGPDDRNIAANLSCQRGSCRRGGQDGVPARGTSVHRQMPDLAQCHGILQSGSPAAGPGSATAFGVPRGIPASAAGSRRIIAMRSSEAGET